MAVMIAQVEGLPPLDEHRAMIVRDPILAPRPHSGWISPDAKYRAHGGYPSPRRGGNVYACESCEGEREKLGPVPARTFAQAWFVEITVGSLAPARPRRWWDRLRWAW